MAAKIPPDKYLPNWATNSNTRVPPGLAKEAAGFKIGESPARENLNHMWGVTGAWNEVAGRTLAAKMAMRNVEYTTISIGPAQVVDSMHIDYFEDADRWYCTGVDTSGNVYCTDSADGETWNTTVYPDNVGAGNVGDATKFATDGNVCAVAADNKCYTSSDLTVANLDAGTTINDMVDVSDLVYDAGNSLWIAVGQDVSFGYIYYAADPTGTWTKGPQMVAGNGLSLATDGNGNSTAQDFSGNTYYSSNGTTWNASVVDAGIANNIAWAPSLGLFVCRENSTGDLFTSETGYDWRDQNAINSVPKLYNMVHGPDFLLLWGTPATSTNTIDYSELYAFHTMATGDDDYCYQKIGTAWGDTIPYVSALDGIYRCGQGKMIFPYPHTTPTNDTYLAIARYGAT